MCRNSRTESNNNNSVVEYRHPEDAKRAIHIMNKAEFMGRPVFVREVIIIKDDRCICIYKGPKRN